MKLVVNLVAVSALLALSSCMSTPAVMPTQAARGPDNVVPLAGQPRSQLAFYLGSRSFDQDLWSPVEDQGVFMFEYSHQDGPDAFGWEVGAGFSGDDDDFGGFAMEARTGEVYGGIRKTFGSETVRPYLGGGLSLIRAELDVGGADDSDTSAAAYLHGGVQFLVSPTFFLGIDIRGVFGSSIDLGGVDGDADYGQGALTFGWRF